MIADTELPNLPVKVQERLSHEGYDPIPYRATKAYRRAASRARSDRKRIWHRRAALWIPSAGGTNGTPRKSALPRIVPNAAEDTDLLVRAKAGDRAAFDQLVIRHRTSVIKFLVKRGYARWWHQGEDIVQDAMVKAYRRFHQFAGRSAFGTWLTKIAIRTALNANKRIEKHNVGLQEVPIGTRGLGEAGANDQKPHLDHLVDVGIGVMVGPYNGPNPQAMLLRLFGEGIDGQSFRDERASNLRRPELRGGSLSVTTGGREYRRLAPTVRPPKWPPTKPTVEREPPSPSQAGNRDANNDDL
jgi:RNA polymerase sigma factor (sigma-70 family)